jgi:hypothetical protein
VYYDFMKPILNQEDIKLIREALKPDLEETKKDLKTYVTHELGVAEGRIKEFVRREVAEETASIVRVLTQDIKLEETLTDHEKRIKAIEDITPTLTF